MLKNNLFFALVALLVMSSCGDANTETNEDNSSSEVEQETKTPEASTEWNTIGNDLYSIKYPSDWTRNMEVVSPVHFALISPSEGDDDVYGENIYLVVKELFDPALSTNEDFGLSLDRIAEDFVKQINTILPGGKVLRSERKEMNGLDFHEIQYLGSDGTNDTVMLNRFWLDKGRSYVINYTGLQNGGYKNNEDAATKIMDSFVIN